MSRTAAYGRYARNAMIQGAAAELFKVWAVIVRARCAPLGARIVLCLHDELLVHAPRDQAEAVSRLVDECLREAAQRWAPSCGVRFISDTTTVRAGLPPDAEIVLCLHDELLVQARSDDADAVAQLLADALAATTRWWAAGSDVRFVADVTVAESWADTH